LHFRIENLYIITSNLVGQIVLPLLFRGDFMLEKVKVHELCQQFEAALTEQSYSEDSMYRYRKCLKEFKKFAGDVNYAPRLSSGFLTKIMGEDKGFSEKGTNSKLHMYYLRTMRSLEHYYLFGTFQRRLNETTRTIWPEPFRKPLGAYFHALENRSVTTGYQRNIDLLVRSLISYLYKHEIHSFEEMTSTHVTGFISSQVGFKPKTMSGKVSGMRGVLKFLYLEGYISVPLSESLPVVKFVFRTTVPTVWKPEELQKVKESIDLGNPTGKRDYAIVLLVASTGLRAGDVINLKLSDIDWERKEINITQNKTSEALCLPLMDSTGWALIDYIKYARPESQHNNVFLSHLPPFEPFQSSASFYTLLTRYVAIAGVAPGGKSKLGIHSLRHTLASELLQNNVELNTIADILGHADPETTKNYLKVNMAALSRCTLEVIFDEE